MARSAGDIPEPAGPRRFELDVVALVEGDDLLSFFGHGRPRTEEARRWVSEQIRMALSQMEGFDEVMKKILGTMSPEQRLAGLPAEQLLPVLPEEILRVLSDDYIASLPDPTRNAIRSRMRL